MRQAPSPKYLGQPCSYVGVGCAYEDFFNKEFIAPMLTNLADDGWSTLENTNKYIRELLPIKKKIYYKRAERFVLKDFLQTNNSRCLVCVYGHFIYVNGKDYWSFFDNENDKVVCVWYLKEG